MLIREYFKSIAAPFIQKLYFFNDAILHTDHQLAGHIVTTDPFTERLAKVRHRFTTTVGGKIEDCWASLPLLSGEGAAAAATVDEIYRRAHDIVGIGPTVGFNVTGQAARNVEQILLPARRAGRRLDVDEIAALRTALQALRETVRQELQSADADPR
jgi:chemotaxis protein histidine kinase CheA